MTQITSEMVLRGYLMGLFPMADSHFDPVVRFVCPEKRALIPLDDDFHIPKSLTKYMKKTPYLVTINECFEEVIESCAALTLDREETWINDEILNIYKELHHLGYAHSVEVWEPHSENDNRLIGGLYGVAMGSAFFGESMFSRQTNASKIALVHLVLQLREKDYTILDAQFDNHHLRQFGLQTVSHDEFLELLEEALTVECAFDGGFKT